MLSSVLFLDFRSPNIHSFLRKIDMSGLKMNWVPVVLLQRKINIYKKETTVKPQRLAIPEGQRDQTLIEKENPEKKKKNFPHPLLHRN